MLRRMLSGLGYQVLEARDVDHCLAMVQDQGRIDLLLLDVIMPGLNGREVFDRVAALRPGIKALFMSGYAESVVAQHGVLDEGIHFIHKPFSHAALSQKIRGALAGH